ncbi:hypothetical protein GCM10027347_45180 [Larkinella harenae]
MTFEEHLNHPVAFPDFDASLPDWLQDEDLLRDEAVLLGLSDVKPDDKTNLIRSYFQHLTAYLDRERQSYAEQIGELDAQIEQKTISIARLQQKTVQLEEARPDGEPQFMRTGIGLFITVLLLVGNYFLIEETVRPAFRASQWVTLGVFLTGLFGLYHRSTGIDEGFRPLLLELGLPLATSFFVFVQALQHQTVIKSAGLFLFVFFLFLTAGKLLPGLLTALGNDLRYWNQEKGLKKERETKTQIWKNEVNLLTVSIDTIRRSKQELVPALHRIEAEQHRINARRDLLIRLFDHEFNLARSLRNRLSERQRQNLIGELMSR